MSAHEDDSVHAITKVKRLSVWWCIKSETQTQDGSSTEDAGDVPKAGLLKAMAMKSTTEVRKTKRIRLTC